MLLETLKQEKFNEGLKIVVNKGAHEGVNSPDLNSG